MLKTIEMYGTISISIGFSFLIVILISPTIYPYKAIELTWGLDLLSLAFISLGIGLWIFNVKHKMNYRKDPDFSKDSSHSLRKKALFTIFTITIFAPLVYCFTLIANSPLLDSDFASPIILIGSCLFLTCSLMKNILFHVGNHFNKKRSSE